MLLQFRNDTQMNWGDCIEGSLLDRVQLVLGFPAIKHTVWYDKWSQLSPRNSSVCKICTFCVEESLLFLLLSSRLMILQVTIVARMGFQKSPLNFPADAYRCNCALLSCLHNSVPLSSSYDRNANNSQWTVQYFDIIWISLLSTYAEDFCLILSFGVSSKHAELVAT